MSGGSRAARGDEPPRQRPRAGSTSPAPTHTLRIVGAHRKLLILVHPPICMQVDGGVYDHVMTRSWSWRRVGARSAAGSSPTSSAGAVWRHLLFDVRRCDSNSSQIPFLSALPPSLARRRWLIFRSLSVQLSLTRPPPRSAPPPPTPRALCPARRARFALPQSNRAPAAPAPRRVSPCARVVRPWRLKPPRDPAIEPWSPPAAAHPGFELLWHALLQVLRTFARCHHRFGRPSLPPPPPFPLRTRRVPLKNRIPEAPFARFPQARRSFDRGSNPSRSCMSRSNPPALARGTASGRTRGRHMAPTRTVPVPGSRGARGNRGEWMGAWARHQGC